MTLTDTSWRQQAACRSQDPTPCFPDDSTDRKGNRRNGGSANAAKAICTTCPAALGAGRSGSGG